MDSLYDLQGNRLYLTDAERAGFLKAAGKSARDVRSFCEVLHYTGCRISEALTLQPRFVDLEQKVIVIETLKRRQKGKFREVPSPDRLIDTLDLVHGLRENKLRRNELLWSWSRTTAWRKVKAVMDAAGIGNKVGRALGVDEKAPGIRGAVGTAISAGAALVGGLVAIPLAGVVGVVDGIGG